MSRRARLPRAFWPIWTALLLAKAGGFVVITLALYLTTQQHLSESRAGVVVAMFGVGGACGVLVGGAAADRFGRKTTMMTAALTSALTLGVLSNVENLYAMSGLIALFGFGNAMLGPAAIAAIADVVPIDDRDRAFNLMFWAMNLGTGAATLLAGFLAELSYRLLFWLDAGTGVTIAVLVLFAVPESLPHKVNPVSRPKPAGRFVDVWRDRVFLVFVLLTFGQAFVFQQSQTTLPLQMTADGLAASDYGMVLATGSVLIVGGQLLVPRLIARWKAAGVLAASMVFLGIGFGGVALAGNLGGYLACCVIWTVGSMLAAPPNATAIAGLAPPGMRGRYQGVFSLVFPLASFAGPAIGGFTLEHLGGWHWGVLAGVGLATAVAHLVSGPKRQRTIDARDTANLKDIEAVA